MSEKKQTNKDRETHKHTQGYVSYIHKLLCKNFKGGKL